MGHVVFRGQALGVGGLGPDLRYVALIAYRLAGFACGRLQRLVIGGRVVAAVGSIVPFDFQRVAALAGCPGVARDDRDANQQAQSQGYVVLAVRRAGALSLPSLRAARFPLVLFTQELLALLRSGISLVEALETLAEKDSRASSGPVLAGLLGKLREGQSFSNALQGFPEDAQLATDTAATALAVLSFQGAGFNHREHQYKDVVRGGLDFLVKSQKENGDLFVPLDDDSNRSVWLYSHSLAAIALCEAYGMTQDPELKEPAQKALNFIVASQHPERGGWRYSPGVGSDTSVT